VGLVNNMPDAALAGTERQFAQLFACAAPGLDVRLSFFSLDGIARSSVGHEHLKQNAYRSVGDFADARLDALVVTGTEPKRPVLEEEPYWPGLTRLFDWLDQDGPPVMLSCLAAHAAVQHFDGIRRRRLPEKCFGMFAHIKVARGELTKGLAPEVYVAHSRWNEVAGADLARCGYRILTFAPAAGVDLFVREKRNTWLFFQGHPEYDPGALGREFLRDVRRYLAHERDTYPAVPKNYFGAAESQLLAEFEKRATAAPDERLMESFPAAVCPRDLDKDWQSPAAAVIGAWLRQIADAKSGKTPAQYARGDQIESLAISQP
jgi:homoserine O-succinyltransferase